ncbi:leucine efflux protein LeuE [Streptomyces sp. NPDC051018]|uniref:leucine efflux protein LeuE n=1 Tax=Streptomyces sp. NPDC051018 TaxID=3365639 RepID=UPI00378F6DDD
MLGVTDLPAYLAGMVLIILLPGPNSLYVVSVAARLGVRGGYRAAAGVFCGDTVLMVLSAAGVASLLQTNDLLFGIVKFAGAGYLSWLAIGMLRAAWGMWRARREPDPGQPADGVAASGSVSASASGLVGTSAPGSVSTSGAGTVGAPGADERPFRKAFLICLVNPKAILFFVAFFVQFVDPAYPYPALSFTVLGLFAQLASFLYLSLLIFTGTHLAAAFRRRRRLSAGATSAVGALFLGFAVKLSLGST